MSYKIAISGSTGLIGSNLKKLFEEKNNIVIPITRFDFHQGVFHLIEKFKDVDVVINLAGEPIVGRWTKKKRQNILNSRIQTTRLLIGAINKMEKAPKVFISCSSIAIYDNIEVHDEFSFNYGKDFLADVSKFWEKEALKLKNKQTRCVILRLGLVLSEQGGILKRIVPFYKMGLGVVIGDGKQFMPWIHLDDVLKLISCSIENNKVNGIYNVVAPQLIRNYTFSITLSSVLNSSLFLRIPNWLLRLVCGECSAVLSKGQQVIPHRLLAGQFDFTQPKLKEALLKCLQL